MKPSHSQLVLVMSIVFGVMGGILLAGTNAPAGMVSITGGVFKPMFRSPTDFKEVSVRPFYLDILPVTNGDFLEFVRANSRWQRSHVKRLFADESYLKNWAGDVELRSEEHTSELQSPTNLVC